MEKSVLQARCSSENLAKLTAIHNPVVLEFISSYAALCNPDTIFVRTDSEKDSRYIRKQAIKHGEERALAIKGHTVHFDGFFDQARDKTATQYLLPKGKKLGANLNTINRDKGTAEVKSFLKNSMQGKELIVCFFGLGPVNSPFFIPAVQLTDSFYVAHSEGMLYRSAYEAVKKLKPSSLFFRFVHTAGALENGVSKNRGSRRIYIDLEDNIVYSTNTQYAGNTVGLKKLALRLAIQKASRENWLAEHMFITGVHGPSGRVTYFVGAFPSACGKTSTAMIKGESIIGDDIAYLRKINGAVRAVNVEAGIFGIIGDVNPQSDPLIWNALTTPGEVIFSNVLIDDKGTPYWRGSGIPHPQRGINFSGKWYVGKLDEKNEEIPFAHKNARYTVRLKRLENCDKNIDNPNGVEVGAVIYGGRDSDTWVPVQQAFDWTHGVITMGSSLESETTAATLGKEGVRTFNLMSNLDFLSIPIKTYIAQHLSFVKGLKKIPLIFSVNYFLRDGSGVYLNAMDDKKIWLKWMELRVAKEVKARRTPTGYIPMYPDLRKLFSEYLGRDYSSDDYCRQFALRVSENLTKIERVINIYKKNAPDCPAVLFTVLNEQRKRLEALADKHGMRVDPFTFEELE